MLEIIWVIILTQAFINVIICFMISSMGCSEASPRQTKLEAAWFNPLVGTHLFKSEHHSVMAVADPYAKFPMHVVVAPRDGRPGEDVRFSKLPRLTRRLLHEVADAVEQKIEDYLEPEQRVVTHTEGFGINDHAHIVLFAAIRGEGESLYDKAKLVSPLIIQHTLDVITFNPIEAMDLEQQLDQVSRAHS
jgi:diadenosine tetraphosphate (Ap4A) HIT family hydrolase